jgi:NAD+ kinase
VQYFVTARDPDRGAAAVEALEAEGYDLVDEYDPAAVTVVLGGDGSILYAARQYPEPTMLPVRSGASKGHQTSLDESELLSAVETIEDGTAGQAYRVERYDQLTAASDDADLSGEFTALNDVCLHHREPTMAAEFAVTLHTSAGPREFPELIGDGLVVATPFGSSAYFRSITGTTFETGLGVAFNNVHWPDETPDHVRLGPTGRVDLRILEADNAAAAVLTRDNDPNPIPLHPGATVTIAQSDRTVSVLRLDP